MGYNPMGKKVVRSGWGASESEAVRKMNKAVSDYQAGLVVDAKRYTVADAVSDWLEHGQGRRAGVKTRGKNRDLCNVHIFPVIGGKRLAQLTVVDVDRWLLGRAEVLATSTLQQVRWCLRRALQRAVARGFADQKALLAVELAEVPQGQPGRDSKSLTLDQARDVLDLTRGDPMHPYIVLSLLAGLRTEEVRALCWDHLHLDADPPHVWVWRSDRAGGDTKTVKSRRTLALPQQVVTVLRTHRAEQARQRLKAGADWQDTGRVFATRVGTGLDAANVRRDFRRALKAVPDINPKEWTPRELRHSFVSLLSEHGVSVEEIARLVGHKGGSHVTEMIYRKELRPIIQTAAQAMDDLFQPEAKTDE